MKAAIYLSLLFLLASHVALSERPSEVNAAVLLHVASLGLSLFLMFVGLSLRRDGFRLHRFSAWIIIFICYFFTVEVILSSQTGLAVREVMEFPYRIANLLIALFLPYWISGKEELRHFLRICCGLVVIQSIRDVTVFATSFGTELLTERLAGAEFSSLLIPATPGFLVGWVIADWKAIREQFWLRCVLALATILVAIRMLLSLSRTLWFVIIPLDIILILFILKGFGQKRTRRFVVRGVGLVLVTVSLVIASSQTLQANIVGRLDTVEHYMSAKIDEFQAAVTASKDNVLLGKGFAQEIGFYKGARYREQAHIHNIFLQFLLSSGVVGLALLLWGLLLLGVETWRLGGRARTALEIGIAAAVVLTLSNFLVLGMIQSIARREHTYLVVAICITMLVVARRMSRERVSRSVRANLTD